MTDEAKAAMEKAVEEFTEYFVRNYPGPDTIIYDPKWHAPKIFRAALYAALPLIEPQNRLAEESPEVRELAEAVDQACKYLRTTPNQKAFGCANFIATGSGLHGQMEKALKAYDEKRGK